MTGITYQIWRLCGIVFILPASPLCDMETETLVSGVVSNGAWCFRGYKVLARSGRGNACLGDLLIKELSLLSISWVSLFPAAILGGWNLHNLGLIAILPCAVRFIILNHAGAMRPGKPREKIVTTWLPGHALAKSR